MSLVTNFIFITFFYLIGSIPFALILTKLLGHGDIRDIGSGNVGATNVLRTGNKYLAFTVLFLDIFKGVLPFIILSYLYDANILHSIFLCHFAILGHIFPIWLKFKGGKGVATHVGILFSINIILGFVFVASWVFIFLLSKYSSLSSIIGSISIPIYILIAGQINDAIFFTIMFILIFFTHRENIKRLKNKEESKTKIY